MTDWLGPLFAQSAFGLALLEGPEGRIVGANASLCSLLGREEAELTRLTLPELAEPEDVVANQRLLHEVLSGRRHGYRLESLLRRRDGEVIWAHMNVFKLECEAGKPCTA